MEIPKILIVPFGDVAVQVMNPLCERVAEILGKPCCLGDSLPVPTAAFNARRHQYSAETLLGNLLPGNALRILGVVELDLFVPELNFVFGLADPSGRRALIALPRLRQQFYRLAPDESIFHQRAVKEAVHEMGHTLNLDHCRDRRCVMAFSNSLQDTDYKNDRFCLRCAGRLHW